MLSPGPASSPRVRLTRSLTTGTMPPPLPANGSTPASAPEQSLVVVWTDMKEDSHEHPADDCDRRVEGHPILKDDGPHHPAHRRSRRAGHPCNRPGRAPLPARLRTTTDLWKQMEADDDNRTT